MTLGDLRTAVRTRLGDGFGAIWPDAEIDGHLRLGYQQLATTAPVFWDQTYLENLPRGFSYTQTWEQAIVVALVGGFDYGAANYTMADERRADGDARLRVGPGNHTSPFEVTDGFLSTAGASTAIPATAELPATVIALTRVTWDTRGIDALQARSLSRLDARYEVTTGEVYGYVWQKDGVRTLRKVRVPAAQADTVTVDGSWGLLRDPTDVSTETVTGTWGIARRIPGHHPIGFDLFGAPRRVFLDGTNVRVEHVRHGRPLTATGDVCELPDRYAIYLRDYALAQCLDRPSAGQDQALAAHFLLRWTRGVARVVRRCRVVDPEKVHVLGGTGRASVGRPPRPALPWAYGSRVR